MRALLCVSGIEKQHILVLTGYQWMIADLRELANANGWAGVRVEDQIQTIDSAQGAEGEIVILCCVRTYGNIGFLNAQRRANVATSRQREAFFVIGKYAFIPQGADAQQRNWLGYLFKMLETSVGPAFVANPS